jgi:endonuclease-3
VKGRDALPASPSDKKTFDINIALERIEKSVRSFPKAAMFELAEKGFGSAFEQVIGCIISVRTRDETTLKVAYKLFAEVRTPEQMLSLTPEKIDELIHASTFHEQKSYRILEIARIITEKYGGSLPCQQDILLSLPGVGPKCANLVLGIVGKQPFISVDIHVHRVSNRWGFVQAKTPEATMKALEKKVPENLWIDVNRLIMPFGKHICTGDLPKCSSCPVLEMCQQVGVTSHR